MRSGQVHGVSVVEWSDPVANMTGVAAGGVSILEKRVGRPRLVMGILYIYSYGQTPIPTPNN